MKKLIWVIALLFAASAFAQPAPDTLWTRTYGSGEAHSVIQTSDGCYVFAGRTLNPGPNSSDFYLKKVDSNGTTIWSRTYGGAYSDNAYSVQETTDGGYIVCGTTYSFGSIDFYLIKTDSTGNAQWSRTYGRNPWDEAYSVQQTTDGGYIISGYTSTSQAPLWADFYLVKTNSNGDTIWTRTYGGIGGQGAYSVQQTSDSGYIMAGYNGRGAGGGEENGEPYIVKTDSHGDTIWTRICSSPWYGEVAYSVRQTADGGYIVATAHWGRLLKIYSNGDIDWIRYSSTQTYNADLYSAQQTSDWGYIATGYVYLGAGNYDLFLLKTDRNGDTLWTHAYGGPLNDMGYSVTQTTDGGFILAGTKDLHFYLVKTVPAQRSLLLLSPNYGDQWHISQIEDIHWWGHDIYGSLKIELNRNYPDGIWETLIDSTENDGEEAVFVTGPRSSHCRMRISTLSDTLVDISDGDFSIAYSYGYLALIRATNPNDEVSLWDAGVLECPNTSSVSFHLKNFGSESITVYPPEILSIPHFSLECDCNTLILAPAEISACSLTVTYDPLSDGIHHDTLRIMTNAVNAEPDDHVHIPLIGEQISTPQVPVVMINIEGNDARLTWEPITESILGCPVTVTGYLIFYSSSYEGPYYFLNFTPDTSYVHTWVARFASSMFYEAYAYTGAVDRLEGIRNRHQEATPDGTGRMTREEVMERIKN